jgi:hypothetical protein
VYLRKTVRAWFIHRQHVRSFNVNWKAMEYRLLTIPALRSIGYEVYREPAYGVCATAVIDFGTSLEHTRPYQGTCQAPERSHVLCLVINHSPHYIFVRDLPLSRERIRLEKSGRRCKLMYTTMTCIAYSKAKTGSSYQMNACRDAIHILNTG